MTKYEVERIAVHRNRKLKSSLKVQMIDAKGTKGAIKGMFSLEGEYYSESYVNETVYKNPAP